MTSPIHVKSVSREEADRERVEALASADDNKLTRDCGFVRAILWALTSGGRPVHILRILNEGVEIAGETREEGMVRAGLRSALDQIAEAGDALDLGDGWWLPAATREVELPGSDTRLLVGGVPTTLLPPHLRTAVAAHGPFRRTHGDRLRFELELPTQTLESWSEAPRVPLQEWAAPRLTSALAKYTEPNDGARFRFYSTEQARLGAAQWRRWTERPQIEAGRLLVQRTRVFGAREYRVAELRGGRIVAAGALQPGEHLRLMYALDERAKNPVSVTITHGHDFLSMKLLSEVPRAEQRLFASLGDRTQDDENYYPRAWRFAAAHREFVDAQLRGLGILVKSDFGKGSET